MKVHPYLRGEEWRRNPTRRGKEEEEGKREGKKITEFSFPFRVITEISNKKVNLANEE